MYSFLFLEVGFPTQKDEPTKKNNTFYFSYYGNSKNLDSQAGLGHFEPLRRDDGSWKRSVGAGGVSVADAGPQA